MIGIVGLATFNTLRKTKEIGVRRVFGATPTQVLLVLFDEFSWVLLLAILVAVPTSWYAATNWLQGFAYRTAIPWCAFGYTLTGTVLLIMSIVWIQDQKAISSNPTRSLRSE